MAITHVTGQGEVAQLIVSFSTPHGNPPLLSSVVAVRVRDCEPLPHVLEHVDQEDQVLTLQSTGQPWVLQFSTTESGRQEAPPLLACIVTVRLRDRSPLPQEREQLVHGLQLLSTQSTGHPWL